jgi:aldehyde dehydrogenase (NAD+)
MSRLIAHTNVHDELVERSAALAESLLVSTSDEHRKFGTNRGAMISSGQRNRAEGLCRNAERDGAKLVTGGHRLNKPGSFLAPTIFSDVTSDVEIDQTEVFGSVLAVLKTTSEADAIQIANSTDYGLFGGILTADIDAAHKATRHIRPGQIFINE